MLMILRELFGSLRLEKEMKRLTNNMEFSVEKSESWKMFNEISPRYDMLNRILSLGMDRCWRREMGKFLEEKRDQTVLDLATGTGDVPLILVEENQNIKSAIGIDLADQMLEVGQRKIAQKNLAQKIQL